MRSPSILYGVQGTGNGHISRARLMAAEFTRIGIDVEYLFSGRAANNYFDMEEFTRLNFGTGLSFVTSQGRIRKLKTLKQSQPLRYAREVLNLRTDRHDLIISDFEPTASWAARLRKTPTLALGHQYALDATAPQPQGELFAKWVIRHFAPADTRIGFHWHRYGRLTLPPMIDTELTPIDNSQAFTLVYLPFEDQNEIAALLQQIKGEHFVMYSPNTTHQIQRRNISIYPLSKPGFKHHLQRCNRVICNTGFELISEALHLGIPILTRPLIGQFEQQANALALKELNLATITRNLGVLSLDKFIHTTQPQKRILYPNVARELAAFCQRQITEGMSAQQSDTTLEELARSLWAQVEHQAGDTLHSDNTELPPRLAAA
ncbi:MJ1255/VC2487 family glycosyltransferase [Granulosicoccus antarcticus]|uniref:Glycosyltransferase n=1 Tax=Granulosicoccus antarcticus IMCC3135 TaxID=1192854 RepID=A0A2Z2NSI0_9GAMM|nr:MJ1255/VC2487 family glycosyltransferase [Granulosicoccus antarcticus]ASJ70537.1 hypothetical protein IMCC3135_02115 [Granulosicoccus antarcticus IMCC3135]